MKEELQDLSSSSALTMKTKYSVYDPSKNIFAYHICACEMQSLTFNDVRYYALILKSSIMFTLNIRLLIEHH